MQDLILGADVGTTAVKSVLFTLEGKQIASAGAEYPTNFIRAGWVSQNPHDWWDAFCTATQSVLSQVQDAPERIAGLAISSQAPTMLALDEQGAPLYPALIWMDRRAEAEVGELCDIIGEERIKQITGNRPDAYYVAAKIRWLKNNEPELFKRVHQFVQITGYLNFRLTGTYSIDEPHTGLLQLIDKQSGNWSDVMLEACGVSSEQFPPIHQGHIVQGEVTTSASAQTGLRVGTPVFVGGVDGTSAALEAGVAEPGIAAEMTGTSTVLLMPNTENINEPAFISMPHCIPGMQMLLGAIVSTGASLRWYRDQFGAIETQKGDLLGISPFELMTAQAAQVEVGSQGVIFLPYMMGERSPIWHTQARGVLFGLSLATSRAAIIRALLEGTAFALRHNVDVGRAAGIELSEIRSVGGGAKSDLWNQIKADILGVPILLPEAGTGAPFGNALMVGMGLGIYPDIRQTVRDTVKIGKRYEPNLANHAHYNEIYYIFRQIYESLRGDFNQAAAVFQQ